MKGFSITHIGLENIASEELIELNCKIKKIEKTVIFFETEDLKKVTYLTQSSIKILELISSFDVDDNLIENIKKCFKNIKINNSFKIKCKRIGEHNFSSTDIEQETAEPILKNNENKVDLKEPETIIYIYIFEKRCYIGIDISKKDLSKREYKIFAHQASLKGTLAYLLLKISKYNKDKILIDPMCGSGTILIEGALKECNISPNHYSNIFKIDMKEGKQQKLKLYGYDYLLKNILASRKNAKIAGVNDATNFSKIDISWIDTKHKEKSIDIIVSDPPRRDSKDFKKLMNSFFKQSKDLLKDNGNICLIINPSCIKTIEEESKRYNFKQEQIYKTASGKENFLIIKFVKK